MIWTIIRCIKRLRAGSYDLVIDFEQFAYISSLLAFVAGIPRRVGFLNPTHMRHLLFTDAVPYRETEHMSAIFQRLVTSVTGPLDLPADRSLYPGISHEAEADAFLEYSGLSPGTPFILIHPGSSPNFTSRQWPVEKFASLADRIVSEGGYDIVVTGSAEESRLAKEMLGMMVQKGVSAAGKISIMGLAALCRRSSFVVSSDTLLVHLGSAVGTPVVGLYGPNTPFLYGPGPGEHHTVFYKDAPCSPCLVNINRKISDCRSPRCMEEISVDEVWSAIHKKYFKPSTPENALPVSQAAASLPPTLTIVK